MDYQALWEAWGPRLLGYAVSIVSVIALLLVTWLAARWARRAAGSALQRAQLDETLVRFFANLARYAVLIAGVLLALGVFGVETTSFAAVIAAAGLAIGLALQGTLSNFSAGVMLLAFRPFTVDDLVTVDDETGRVHEIKLFHTTLDTRDNRRVIVPNGNVFDDTIINHTYHPIRRVDVAVGTDYDADLSHTRSVLEKVAAEHHVIDEKDPQVLLTELGGSSINWQVRAWCRTEDYVQAKDAFTQAVKEGLDAAGIGIPYPQRDLHIDGFLRSGPVE